MRGFKVPRQNPIKKITLKKMKLSLYKDRFLSYSLLLRSQPAQMFLSVDFYKHRVLCKHRVLP